MLNISLKIRLLKSFLLVSSLICTLPLTARTYYVDSRKGNDAGSGTSNTDPWKTLGKINSYSFKPGDTIYFHRGSEWTGELIIRSSGNKTEPVVFSAYGTGSCPVIQNPVVERATAIRVEADYVIVENFLVKDSHDAGINLSNGSQFNIIRNNEATRTGIGIAVRGDHNLITYNYAHDLTMVVNNPGGDNDYGAVGIWLFASNNEVSHNRMINCKAPSLDYGFDGGVVEFYGDVDSCYVHHNYGENCEGAFEVGGKGVTLTHNIISYNVCINNGGAGGFHVGGKFGVKVEDMRIENNVFADTSHANYTIGFWGGTPGPEDFSYRNNIFYIPNYHRVSNLPGFIHENNLYFLGGKTDIGILPGPGDKIGNPLFKDVNQRDFHLKADSPAIDAGKNLNYNEDFDGIKVPKGSAPDIGAYEYESTSGNRPAQRK